MLGTSEQVSYRFDFLKYRYIWIAVSILYLIIGVVAYITLGGFRYHIDFVGGAEVRVLFEKPMDISVIRNVMSSKGFSHAEIQAIGGTTKNFLIRLGAQKESGFDKKILAALETGITDNKVKIDNVEWIGAEVSSETTWNAVKAIFLAILLLLLYLAFRFQFRFGVGAVVATLHDLLAVLTFLVLTREMISVHVMAAILAILGYSVNDTIVIFSRIRENLKKFHNLSEYDIVNLSINQTLKRTLLTSFATLLSVIAIFLLGGETLRGLSLVMLIGIIVGTYSSIYIASPVMMAIKNKAKTNQ
jgi:preprotein translocase subunit SecF